ncbi:hypothetical protein ACFQRK_23705 [Parapedobacter sp. GCM10030251]|uniref:hypothetical protein n=1 Tax=Parapedobacter sp. GCM10030251 TaxID=3273419 RepID=UPI00360FB54C
MYLKFRLSKFVPWRNTPAVSSLHDIVTGATRKAISEAAVKDAIYTTYTIWHLIHVGEPEQLALLALSEKANEPTLAHRLLTTEDAESRNFVLRGVIDGHLHADSVIEKSILQGLNAEDNAFRDLAFQYPPDQLHIF